MTRRFTIGWLMAMLWLASANVWAAPAVRAWLDRDTMQLGQTVTLNVEAQASVATAPDFSALARDFKLLGTQSSQQMSLANGHSSAKTLWAVGLEPLHEGRITIPPISIDGASTQALALEVLPQPAGAQGRAGDDVYVEVSAEPSAPWVQEQVRYTVKLFYSFDLTDGNLGEPQADGLTIQRLGQDARYLATVGERRYHVIERRYALTPEKSGLLTIPAIAFRGSALDPSDPASFFSRGRAVTARSDAIELNVKPKPADWGDAPWLPARSLSLHDDGQLPDQVHVGDPITRTIRLQAQGLGYAQLPELKLDAPPGAEVYPDQAQTQTRDDGTWLYGERMRKFAFVPSQPGIITVPGVSVRWWNTQTGRAEVATLPPHRVQVLAAARVASNPPNPPSKTSLPVAGDAAIDAGSRVPAADIASFDSTTASARNWQLLAATGFALWLLTLALWWRSRRVGPAPTAPVSRGDHPASRATFLRACAMGDLGAAERALVAWARAERPDLHSAGEIAAYLDDSSQRDALAALQRVRYAGAPADGIATRLERAYRGGLVWTGQTTSTKTAVLPELYPRSQ